MPGKGDIYNEQIALYTEAFDKHMGTAEATLQVHSDLQNLRFKQIVDQLSIKSEDSLLDYGCGQGDFFNYLKLNGMHVSYYGQDINESYIKYATGLYKTDSAKFSVVSSIIPELSTSYDHIVISGMFHFKGSCERSVWKSTLQQIIINLFKHTRKSLTFNCLTYPVDFERSDLFYWSPQDIMETIRMDLSRFFKIDHSYPLFEWTCTVYKENYIKSYHKDSVIMGKYFK